MLSGYLRGKLGAGAAMATLALMTCQSAFAIDLTKAIEEALRTNPEIGEAAANKRAIDFEYQQAKQIGNPHVIFEGRAGPSWIDSRTSRLFGNDDEILFARQASVTMQKNLYSFGRNEAEKDRQASRVDAASNRVYERSEFVGLDVSQAYFDILRLREIISYADLNVAFHEQMADDLARGVASGIVRETDSLQAQERLASSKISLNEIEESHDIAMAKFTQLVGHDVGDASAPPMFEAFVPKTLENALATARNNNPTIKIAYADLDVARANYRAAKAERKPELGFELSGRSGEHTDSFRDHNNDIRAQLVLKYEFRGGIKNSAVQEHLNWVDEQRQRVMTIERNVDNLVRNAWITRSKMQMRVRDLEQRVATGTKLRDDYQRERVLGNRSLLDILNAQEDLFQSQSSMVTAMYADHYARYRLLASTGQLLEALGLEPRREAKANVRAYQDVPLTPSADSEKRKQPKHYFDTTELEWDDSGLRIMSENKKDRQKQVTKDVIQLSKNVTPLFNTVPEPVVDVKPQSVEAAMPENTGPEPIVDVKQQVVEATVLQAGVAEMTTLAPITDQHVIKAVNTVSVDEAENVQASTTDYQSEVQKNAVEAYLAKTGATPIIHLEEKEFVKMSQRADLNYIESMGVISGKDVVYMKAQ